ncbi:MULTISPECIES: carbamoyltransferase HypF [unclassified Microbulbifer]|uniref:carbamoyltransferase HypF n=1 Tax=unclassified Microbulbifer TaxID=2619833 RepID=UPI0027E3CC44|nr:MULTISPECIES: carbamoyltransferase HypF [unclassified Microbulbifer]
MATERRRIDITGLVQGVGFRPFVYRLARACGLCGWVANDARGVCLEVQGEVLQIREFAQRLTAEKPPHARIHDLTSEPIPLREESGFVIRESDDSAAPSAIVLPDLAACDDCLKELFDPDNRRYRYPFTNCTHCGPRYSIVERLPYDRANTAMKYFPLCEDCRCEYADPGDRRYHAEPNACPECGPQLQLCDRRGKTIAVRENALHQAVVAIDAGRIVALKGVGGIQLLVDASNAKAVRKLRERKQRPHKPFALLYPDIDAVHRDCDISKREELLLSAQERPIVLLSANGRSSARIAMEVAPQNPNLGAMLPCSPLHHLLMESLRRPVVATSGNLAGEPICIDNDEAVDRLGNIADLFLLHDRPILRPLDDSVLRVMDERPVMLRRARGYAPLPLQLPDLSAADDDLLAVGADLKNCVALARGNIVYPGQHIGDLENRIALETFERAIDDLADFYRLEPRALLCDLHPGYASNHWAQKKKTKRIGVQHHLAHFFSCMAEHAYRGPALGVCWDGTGYGEDGTVRGGEFLHWNDGAEVKHFASLRPFPLPGGERAVREPRRSAAGLLFESLGREAFAQEPLHNCFNNSEIKNLTRMLERNINSPRCTSVGRLFDAVATLLGLATEISFEGQAAMAVEYVAQESDTAASYPFDMEQQDGRWVIDWVPTVVALMEEGRKGTSIADRSAAFHNTLAQIVLSVALNIGEEHVFLSGGVFQNRRLTETAAALLRRNDFRVHCHSSIPPNDGGIALGQIYYARCMAACGIQVGEGSALCV